MAAVMLAAAAVPACPSETTLQKVQKLQEKFDRERNAVSKAKQMTKLGEAQFELTREAGEANDYETVGLTMEKYRDNVRSALNALVEAQPNAEKHPNGYKQLQINVTNGLREVDDTILVAPEAIVPPLRLVRKDLSDINDRLLRRLFPRRPADRPVLPTPKKQEKGGNDQP